MSELSRTPDAAYVAPVGRCCSRDFYTWEDWTNHLFRHRSGVLAPLIEAARG